MILAWEGRGGGEGKRVRERGEGGRGGGEGKRVRGWGGGGGGKMRGKSGRVGE